MKTVGEKLPDFRLQAVVSTEPSREFATLENQQFRGKWLVLFFWPMDFTFVCPTEIAEFGNRYSDFKERGVNVLGGSTDTHFVHLAWRKQHPDLKSLPFPLLADTRRELSTALGILHPEAGVATRATFIVNPEGVIRHVSVNDLSVGRDVNEVLRLVDAFQNGGLTPCNWRPGQPVLSG